MNGQPWRHGCGGGACWSFGGHWTCKEAVIESMGSVEINWTDKWSLVSYERIQNGRPVKKNNHLQNKSKLKRPCSHPLSEKWWQMELKLTGD